MQGADGYRQGYDDLVGQWPFLHQKVPVRLPVRRNLEAPLLKTCECVRRLVKNLLTALRDLGVAAFHTFGSSSHEKAPPERGAGAAGYAILSTNRVDKSVGRVLSGTLSVKKTKPSPDCLFFRQKIQHIDL